MTDTSKVTFKRDIRIHGKLPRVVVEEVSYPLRVRDGMLNRIKMMPFFAAFNFTSNKAKVILTESIPFCGVYILQEFMASDGDAQAGQPRFRTTVRYGVSVIIQDNDTEKAEWQLDKALQTISRGLFTDPTFYNNSYFKIQGFTGGKREHVFGHIGSDQQTPIAELRWELMCDLGVIDYPPVVPDMLEVIHEETIFPDDTTGDPSRVQQVVVEYDIDQNNVDDPND